MHATVILCLMNVKKPTPFPTVILEKKMTTHPEENSLI